MHEVFKKPKVIIGLTVGLLFLIFFLQNTEVVSIQFLFWKLSMSRIILMPILILIGFIIGFVTSKMTKDYD